MANHFRHKAVTELMQNYDNSQEHVDNNIGKNNNFSDKNQNSTQKLSMASSDKKTDEVTKLYYISMLFETMKSCNPQELEQVYQIVAPKMNKEMRDKFKTFIQAGVKR